LEIERQKGRKAERQKGGLKWVEVTMMTVESEGGEVE
jgi:hypothetical protein